MAAKATTNLEGYTTISMTCCLVAAAMIAFYADTDKVDAGAGADYVDGIWLQVVPRRMLYSV